MMCNEYQYGVKEFFDTTEYCEEGLAYFTEKQDEFRRDALYVFTRK